MVSWMLASYSCPPEPPTPHPRPSPDPHPAPQTIPPHPPAPKTLPATLQKHRQQITPLAPGTINSSASFLGLILPIIADFNNNDSPLDYTKLCDKRGRERQKDRQTGSHTDRLTDRLIDWQIGRLTDWQIDWDMHMDGRTERLKRDVGTTEV